MSAAIPDYRDVDPRSVDEHLEKIITILFGNALAGNVREIQWEEAPKLMARLEKAGLTIRGEMLEKEFGEKEPVISVEVKIRVRGIRYGARS
jgi:hypothetical protein